MKTRICIRLIIDKCDECCRFGIYEETPLLGHGSRFEKQMRYTDGLAERGYEICTHSGVARHESNFSNAPLSDISSRECMPQW